MSRKSPFAPLLSVCNKGWGNQMVKRVAVLGAGISGLAAAWFLKQKFDSNVELTVMEASPRAGGWIHTLLQDDFLFEQGPRSLRVKGADQAVWDLIEQLELQDQLIVPHSDAKFRYIYHRQHLEAVPGHLWNIPFSPLTKGWLRVLLKELAAPKGKAEDETIYDFFNRRIGSEWTERLIDPFVSGIFAGDIRKLSLKSCFPFFHGFEQQSRSLIWGSLFRRKKASLENPIRQKLGDAPFFSFQRGLETLTQALYQRLEPHIRLNCRPKSLMLQSDCVQVELNNVTSLEFDHLISTIPPYQLAALLQPKHPFLASDLGKLNYASVMLVNLGYRKPVLKQKGFGYLIPSQEMESILGCVWDSSVFPQQNAYEGMTRLTVMIGGSRQPAVSEWTEEKGIALALSAMEKHLGIDAIPDSISVKIANQAIPQYELGYHLWAAGIEKQLAFLSPCISCIGSAFSGVSVSECIAKAVVPLPNQASLQELFLSSL